MRRFIKISLRIFLIIFVLTNVIANFQAYKFTHYGPSSTKKINTNSLTTAQKIKASVFGISGPRPKNRHFPQRPYETIRLKSNKEIECWLMKVDSAKGTAILCHGYGGEKSSMLEKADILLEAGYNTMLVDFMGSGGSEGNTTTIGFYEAQQVKSAYDYLWLKGERNFILLGNSMGAVAIIKAQHDYKMKGVSLILECPFGSLRDAVSARFKIVGAPEFPMADLIVFWGGVQQGFNTFKFSPEQYAKNITCPTLLLYGEQDNRVSRSEIDSIFTHLKGPKTLCTYPLAGHESYLNHYRPEWIRDVGKFLGANPVLTMNHPIY
jgi:alpha-beta hydrolase superfamily lysophospholipase